MTIDFPCFEKKKKHKDFRKTFINNKKINKTYFANSLNLSRLKSQGSWVVVAYD